MARPKPGPAFTFIAVLLRPLLAILCKRDWRGREHVPQQGGVIVVANHYSFFDPISLGHYLIVAGHRTPRFLAKAGVFKQPLLGKLFRSAGQIPVYRDSRDAALAFRDAVAAVERGEVIIVYPEGTMTKDPGLWPMEGKTGAARIALRTGAPVLPIAQWGAQDVFAPYSKTPKFFPRKTLKVTAGEPIDLRALVGAAATKDALARGTDLIMDRITGLLAEIRGEQAPAIRFQPDEKPAVEKEAKTAIPEAASIAEIAESPVENELADVAVVDDIAEDSAAETDAEELSAAEAEAEAEADADGEAIVDALAAESAFDGATAELTVEAPETVDSAEIVEKPTAAQADADLIAEVVAKPSVLEVEQLTGISADESAAAAEPIVEAGADESAVEADSEPSAEVLAEVLIEESVIAESPAEVSRIEAVEAVEAAEGSETVDSAGVESANDAALAALLTEASAAQVSAPVGDFAEDSVVDVTEDLAAETAAPAPAPAPAKKAPAKRAPRAAKVTAAPVVAADADAVEATAPEAVTPEVPAAEAVTPEVPAAEAVVPAPAKKAAAKRAPRAAKTVAPVAPAAPAAADVVTEAVPEPVVEAPAADIAAEITAAVDSAEPAEALESAPAPAKKAPAKRAAKTTAAKTTAAKTTAAKTAAATTTAAKSTSARTAKTAASAPAAESSPSEPAASSSVPAPAAGTEAEAGRS